MIMVQERWEPVIITVTILGFLPLSFRLSGRHMISGVSEVERLLCLTVVS